MKKKKAIAIVSVGYCRSNRRVRDKRKKKKKKERQLASAQVRPGTNRTMVFALQNELLSEPVYCEQTAAMMFSGSS